MSLPSSILYNHASRYSPRRLNTKYPYWSMSPIYYYQRMLKGQIMWPKYQTWDDMSFDLEVLPNVSRAFYRLWPNSFYYYSYYQSIPYFACFFRKQRDYDASCFIFRILGFFYHFIRLFQFYFQALTQMPNFNHNSLNLSSQKLSHFDQKLSLLNLSSFSKIPILIIMQNPKRCESMPKSNSTSSTVQKNLTVIRSTLQKAMHEIKSQQSSSRALSFIKRISLDLDFEKMQKMLEELQKGYVAMKHSPNTSQPHSKYVYISSDRKFLCWKSLEKDDEKMIELRKIENLINKDVQFKVESSTIKHFERMIIVKSEVRTLELEFRSSEEKDRFYDQLRMALKNSRRMNLSYKF